MNITKPCPRCQTSLEIPQPPPEQIRCDKCGAVIKNRASNQTAVTATPPLPSPLAPPVPTPEIKQPSPEAARHSLVVLAGLATGLLLVCLLPIAGLWFAWVFSRTETIPADKTPPVELAKEEEATEKKIKAPPPPDPRLKIVQPAVDKGVAYIRSQVPKLKKERAGYVGLNGLALLECGVPPDDPDVLKIAEYIRAQAPRMIPIYDLSASLFFLNRWHELRPLDEKDSKMARSFALRIIAGQHTNGIWSYGGVLMAPAKEDEMVKNLEAGILNPSGIGLQSMSNTQFAMLAVWGARKHGVPVRAPLLKLAAYFHANQQANGCWNYPGHSLKATSTCAGLIALAIEAALLEDKEFNPTPRVPDPADAKKKKADIEKAFEFVAKTIGRKKEDPGRGSSIRYGGAYFDADAMGDLYFLWTLERVGVIYSREKICGKDWYDWGYPILLKEQKADGSWDEPHKPYFGPWIDTPFALLFLRRANIARDLTEFIRTRGGKEAIP